MKRFLVSALLFSCLMSAQGQTLKEKTFLGVKIGEPMSLPQCTKEVKMQCYLTVEAVFNTPGVTAARIIPAPTGLDNLTIAYMKDGKVIRLEFRTIESADIREAVALLYGMPKERHPDKKWVWDGRHVRIEADAQGVVKIDCKQALRKSVLPTA
jgi:hypothetical protein